jgi:hypothetical protein
MYDFSGRVQNVPFEFLRGQYVLERLRKRRLDYEKTFHENSNEDLNEKTLQIFKTEISENFQKEIIKTKEEILKLRSIENYNNYNGMFHTIEKINEEIFNLQKNIKEKLIQVNNLEKINKEIQKSQSIRSIDRSVRSIDESNGNFSLVALLPIASPDFSNNLRFSLRFSCSEMATIMIKCNGESLSNEILQINECIVFEQSFLIGLYIIEGTITNSYTGLDCTINSPFVESRRLPFDKIKTIELHCVSKNTGTVVVQETTLFNAETVVFTKHN